MSSAQTLLGGRNSDVKPAPDGVVVLDANSMSRKALTKMLAKCNTVFNADNSETAWQLLGQRSLGCAVVDMEHDAEDALALLELIRKSNNPAMRGLPVLVLGVEDTETRKRCMSLGASAYLSKPFDSRELLGLVANPPAAAAGSSTIQAPRNVDPITGLPNQDYFCYRGAKELAFAKRYQKDFSLILFEIDRFEELVHQHGAPMAKQVIRKLGKYLGDTIRGEDTVARLRGCRFGIIAPTCNDIGAKSIVDRVIGKVRSRVFRYGERQLSFTVSAGLASPRVTQVGDFNDVFETAKRRLASAISSGGDQAIVDGRSLENALARTRPQPALDDMLLRAPDTGMQSGIRPAIADGIEVEEVMGDAAPSLDVVMWLLENGLTEGLKPHYGALLNQIMPLLQNAGDELGPEVKKLVEQLSQSRHCN